MAIAYKIKYRDGRTQRVEADSHGVYGDFICFSRDRKDILRIAKDEVESVAHANVPDPESAPIGIA
jgi:hypothetical protein